MNPPHTVKSPVDNEVDKVSGHALLFSTSGGQSVYTIPVVLPRPIGQTGRAKSDMTTASGVERGGGVIHMGG